MPPPHFKVLVIIITCILVQGYYDGENEVIEESSASGSLDLTMNMTTKTKTTSNKKTKLIGTDDERVIMDTDEEEPCKNRTDSVFVQVLTDPPQYSCIKYTTFKRMAKTNSQLRTWNFKLLGGRENGIGKDESKGSKEDHSNNIKTEQGAAANQTVFETTKNDT